MRGQKISFITDMSNRAKSKKGPTVITGDQFRADSSLTLDTIKSWTVDSIDRAAEQLIPEWNGHELGMVTFSLSNDNKAVHNARFVLQGEMFKDSVKVVNANLFWTFPGAVPHQLVLETIPCSLFTFRDNLVSNLVDASELDYSLRPTGKQPLIGTELDDVGFKGFCLRAYIWPTSPCWAKLVILLYPLSKDELAREQPLSVHAAFPGLSLLSVTFPLSQEAKRGARYGLPFLPAIRPGAPFDSCPHFPPAGELVAAAAALLRKTTYPEIKSNANYLRRRWSDLKDGGHNPDALKAQPLTLTWPTPSTTVPGAQGRLAALVLFNLSFPRGKWFPLQEILFPLKTYTVIKLFVCFIKK